MPLASLALPVRLAAPSSRPDGALVHHPHDQSPLHPLDDAFDSRCVWCYLGAAHSVAAHRENVGDHLELAECA